MLTPPHRTRRFARDYLRARATHLAFGTGMVLAAGMVLALIGGCAGDEAANRAGSLSPADFTTGGQFVVVAVSPLARAARATPGDAPAPVVNLNQPGVAALPAGVDVVGPATASEGVGATVGTPGAPVLGAGEVPRVGPAQFVDARVGDINGKPIFASQFFDVGTSTVEPLGRRLAANAVLVRDKKMDVATWRSSAARDIALTLKGLVQDELFRAEAVASLTPEQRQGLFSFLQTIQEDLRRESGGSREAARRRIEEEGLTTEEYLRRREELALIGEQLHTKVTRRVNVTWRDINQAYYGRMHDQFNPPLQYIYRLIIVDGADEAAKNTVTSELAAGKPFAEVASLPLNGSRAATGGLQTPRAVEGDKNSVKFFPSAELDSAAHSLKPGETAGPITLGSQLAWLNFDSIVDGHKNIYDAQLEIYAAIFNSRLGTEQNKYYNQLLSHASITSLEEMNSRLIQIAQERYLIPALRKPAN